MKLKESHGKQRQRQPNKFKISLKEKSKNELILSNILIGQSCSIHCQEFDGGTLIVKLMSEEIRILRRRRKGKRSF